LQQARARTPFEQSLAPIEGAQCRGAMTARERDRSPRRPAEIARDDAKAMDEKGQVLLQAVHQLIHDLDIVEEVLGSMMSHWATDGPWPWVIQCAETLDNDMHQNCPRMRDAIEDVFAAASAMPNSTAR